MTADSMPSVGDFRRRAQSWLAEADIPRLPGEYAGRPQLLRAWHRALYKAGWVGIQWPRDVGGPGTQPIAGVATPKQIDGIETFSTPP